MSYKIRLLDNSLVDPTEIDLDDDRVYYGDLGKLALSSSSCKLLLESPKKYKYVTLYSKNDTKALIIGRLIHLMILEPHRVDLGCTFIESSTRTTKVFKEAKADPNINNAMLFTTAEKKECEKIADACLQNEEVLKLLTKSKTEVGILSEYEGLPFRAKADIMRDNHIIDLKTTTGISNFHYSANNYNYDLQAYLYTQLFGVDKFTFIVVDKGSLDIGIFEVMPEFLERGKAKLHRAIEIYNEYFRGGRLEDADLSNYVLRGELR